jgi:hypothetical protein
MDPLATTIKAYSSRVLSFSSGLDAPSPEYDVRRAPFDRIKNVFISET